MFLRQFLGKYSNLVDILIPEYDIIELVDRRWAKGKKFEKGKNLEKKIQKNSKNCHGVRKCSIISTCKLLSFDKNKT